MRSAPRARASSPSEIRTTVASRKAHRRSTIEAAALSRCRPRGSRPSESERRPCLASMPARPACARRPSPAPAGGPSISRATAWWIPSGRCCPRCPSPAPRQTMGFSRPPRCCVCASPRTSRSCLPVRPGRASSSVGRASSVSRVRSCSRAPVACCARSGRSTTRRRRR